MPVVIGFHYPCTDGIYSALSAHVHFKNAGVTPKWAPLTVYGAEKLRLDLAATLGPEDDLYLLDFSGGVPFLLAACARAKRVILLDHHKTADDDITGLAGSRPLNLDTTFVDMNRSGATLARDYFQPTLSTDVNAAILLVEDNDLWRHSLPDSKAFAAGFSNLKLEMDPSKNPEIWSQLLALDPTSVITTGHAKMAEEAAIIAAEAKTAFILTVDSISPPLKCLAIVSAYPDLRSTAGNLLAEASRDRGLDPVGVIAYTEPGAGVGVIKVSARSVNNFDTTIFSKAFGGGGHKGASSCIVDEAIFASWKETTSVFV